MSVLPKITKLVGPGPASDAASFIDRRISVAIANPYVPAGAKEAAGVLQMPVVQPRTRTKMTMWGSANACQRHRLGYRDRP